MKNFFTFRQKTSKFLTPTSRTRCGSIAVVERTVKRLSAKCRSSVGRLSTLFLLLLMGLGFNQQAWANNGGWNGEKAVSMGYSKNGGSTSYYDYSNSNMDTYDLGTITSSFVIKGIYLKVWDDWGSNYKITGGQLCYKINNGNTQYIKTTTKTSKSGNNFELQYSGSTTIASSTNASGKYTMEHWFQAWGNEMSDIYWNGGNSNYKWTYTILPPAVSGFASSVANSGGGNGTSSNPYIVFYNQNVNLTVSATASPDANSVLQFKVGSTGSWTNATSGTTFVTTIKSNKYSGNDNVVIYYRYYNSDDELAGTEGNTTIYYRSAEYDLTLDHNDGSGNTTAAKVKYGASQLTGNITLPTRTGYKLDGFFKENSATTKVSTAAQTSKLQESVDGYTNSDSKWIKTTTPTTLYAGWTANTYTVTLDKGGSSSGASKVTATYDADMPSATAPSIAYHDFAGYFDGQNGTGNKYYDASMTSAHKWDKAENCTLYAYYTPKQYKITLEQTSATTSGTTEIMATYTQLLPAIETLPQRTGYTFGGYCVKNNSSIVLVNASGSWIKPVTDYIDVDGKWIKTSTVTLSPIWNPNSTTVTLKANGGTGDDQTFTATFDIVVSVPTTGDDKVTAHTRTGYDLNGYFTAATGGSKILDENLAVRSGSSAIDGWLNASNKWKNPNTTADLYAQWTAHTWTITLNDNEGTGGSGTKTATYGTTTGITSVTKPTRDNYSFAGYEDANQVLVYDANGSLIANVTGYTDASKNWIYDNDVTLYAKWNSVGNYVVTLNNQSATTEGTALVEVQINTTKGLTTNITCPEKTGYTFGGYFTLTGGSGTKLINANGSWVIPATDYIDSEGKWIYNNNVTLSAKWTANNYTVTLDNQGATTAGTESVQVTYNSTSNLTAAISVPEKTGYTFGGYFTEQDGTGSQLINADGTWIKDVTNYTGTLSGNPKWIYANNCTLYAKWTFIDYTVDFIVNPAAGGAITTPAESSITAHYNVPFDIAAQYNPGYTFSSWSCSPENSIEFSETTAKLVIADNASITANFTETMHTITINGGTAASVQAGITTTGTATAAERTGYEFTEWTIPADNFTLVDCEVSDQTITFNATADGEVTANYTPSVYTNGALSTADGTAGTYTATYDATSILITATPVRAGYQVEGYYQEAELTNKIAKADGSLVAGTDYVTDGKWNQTSAPALYTKWETATMTITLNVNVDTEVEVEDTDYTQGTPSVAVHYLGNDFTPNPITLPTRQGYSFNGYFTATENGEKIIDAEGHFVTTDVAGWLASTKWQKNTESTLYAQWTAIPSTITFVNNGADIAPGPSTLTAKYNTRSGWNTDITISKAGATFEGYFTEQNGAGVQLIGADGKWIANVAGYTGSWSANNIPVWKHYGDVTLYAKWTTTGKVVYLKNTMNWANAWVYFYSGSYWDASTGAGAKTGGSYKGDYHQMTYNPANGLFYYVASNSANNTYVAFTKDDKNGQEHFWDTEVIYCNNNFQFDKVVVVEREKNKKYNESDGKYGKYYADGDKLVPEYQDLATAQGTGMFIPGTWSGWETKGFEFAWDGTAKKCTLALAEKTSYEFKIFTKGQYWGSSTAITESTAAAGVEFSTTGSNCNLTTKAAGNYIFEWIEGNKLRVTYPTSHQVTWGMGTIVGSSTAPTTNPEIQSPTGLVQHGNQITFTAAAADPGYVWRGWYNVTTYPESEEGKLSAGSDLTFTATINDTYKAYAIYTEETFSVAVVSADVNKGTVSPAAVTAGPSQLSQEITATPQSHYYFSGWNIPEGVSIAEGENEHPNPIHVHATADGKTITANFKPTWTVRGQFNEWAEGNHIENFDGNVGHVDIDLAVGTYEFKVYHHDYTYQYGNDGTMTRENCTNWTFENPADKPNCKIDADIAGTYRFTWNTETKCLSVIYPEEIIVDVKVLADGETEVTKQVSQIKHPEISAQVPDKHHFAKWVISGTAVLADENSATTTITSAEEGAVITATFTPYKPVTFMIKVAQELLDDDGWGNTGNKVGIHYWTAKGIDTYKELDNQQKAGGYYIYSCTFEDSPVSFYVYNQNRYEADGNDRSANWNNATTDGCALVYRRTIGEFNNREITTQKYCSTQYQLAFAPTGGTETYSNIIGDQDEIISLFIGTSGTLKLKKYDPASDQWDGGTAFATVPVSEPNVYNVTLKENVDFENLIADADNFDFDLYTGNFYIRTDAVNSWNDYRKSESTFTSFTPDEGTVFNHYWCKYISKDVNITALVANDYNDAVSARLNEDSRGTSGTGDGAKLITDANIRFEYNPTTNIFRREYLAGSSGTNFITLSGNERVYANIGRTAWTEKAFEDKSNWTYQLDAYAQPTIGNDAKVYVKRTWNNTTADLVGTSTNYHTVMSGNLTNVYKVRVVYDFKTNKILMAWLPEGDTEVADKLENINIMILRDNENEAGKDVSEIRMTGDGSITNIPSIHGVMEFEKTKFEETAHHLYWISFPFDVKVSSIFGGLGKYDEEWILQYYDGKERAKNGCWSDSPSYWKFMDFNTDTMKANEGYVLCLDPRKIAKNWREYDGQSYLYLYFPSVEKAGGYSIPGASVEASYSSAEYECKIKRSTTDGDRTIKDSHWHIYGSPLFCNTGSITGENAPTEFYDYDPETSVYSVCKISEHPLNATHAYLGHINGTFTFSGAVPAQIAARKAAPNNEVHMKVQLLNQNMDEQDRTYIDLLEEALVIYDKKDLSKIINSGKANIYTMSDGKQAVNSLPIESQIVDLGVVVPTTGNYTFTLPTISGNATVTLMDNDAQRNIILNNGDYTVNLTKGTYNNRFALSITLNQIGTDDQMIQRMNKQEGVHKFIRNNRMFILREGKVFDAIGAQLR